MFENLVLGHHGESFPHLCPGTECAILHWIEQKKSRGDYHALERKEVLIYRSNGKNTP